MFDKLDVTIPAYLPELSDEERSEIEGLLKRFGNARRRAYNMRRRKGMLKPEIVAKLLEETGLNSRYAADSYNSIKDLPRANVTFGGKRNQRRRERGKISKEEFHRRRDCILISRGDRSKNGNLNLRVVDRKDEVRLRINIGNRLWICPKLHIPRKYMRK